MRMYSVYMVVSHLRPVGYVEVLKALEISILFSVIMAKVLLVVTDSVLHSKLYVFFENKFIYGKEQLL